MHWLRPIHGNSWLASTRLALTSTAQRTCRLHDARCILIPTGRAYPDEDNALPKVKKDQTSCTLVRQILSIRRGLSVKWEYKFEGNTLPLLNFAGRVYRPVPDPTIQFLPLSVKIQSTFLFQRTARAC